MRNKSIRTGKMLAVMASLAAVVAIAAPALGDQYDNWVGGTAGALGDWATASNWANNYGATAHVPGTMAGTGGYEDVYVNNPSSSAGYTITIDSTLGGPGTMRYLDLANGGNAVTLDISSTGSITLPSVNVGTGIDATINVLGGTLTFGSGLTLGYGLGSGNSVGTETLNVSSGSVIENGPQFGFQVGNQSNGVVNLTGTGSINLGYPASIVLGSSSPAAAAPDAGYGTLNQTGSSTSISVNRGIWVGYVAKGTYTLSSGTSDSGYVEVGNHAQGTLTMTGGTLSTGTLAIGDSSRNDAPEATNGLADGLATVAGGTVTGTALAVGNSTSGTAELQVVGSKASLNFQAGAGSSGMRAFANGTLDFQVGSSGVTTIVANGDGSASTQNDNRSVVALSGLLQIDLLGGFTPVHGAIYTIISTNIVTGAGASYMGIVTTNALLTNYNNQGNYQNTGLTLAAVDDGLWSFNVVVNPAGTATELQATYIGASPPIPEPTPLPLLAFAGAGLLLLARRRRPA